MIGQGSPLKDFGSTLEMVIAAGEWRGLEVAIKTVIFSSGGADRQMAQVSSEAAIASNLSHRHIVSTYSHDIIDVQKAVGPEKGVYKFYLIQVCFVNRLLLALRSIPLGVRGHACSVFLCSTVCPCKYCMGTMLIDSQVLMFQNTANNQTSTSY